MGDQARCTLLYEGAESPGVAHLESTELVVRGPRRLAIPFAAVSGAVAGEDSLTLDFGGETAVLQGLGSKATRWAQAIRHPKPVIDKLGVKEGMAVAVVGTLEEDLLAQLAGRAGRLEVASEEVLPDGSFDLVFLACTERRALEGLPGLRRLLAPAGALWLLRPKGTASITEADVLDAGRAAGLVDTKVVAVSGALSGAKFVIPLADRAGAQTGSQTGSGGGTGGMRSA